MPFDKSRVELQEARALFETQGDSDKVRLLRYRRNGHLIIYSLHVGDVCFRDYFHGYLLPSTGYLRWFGLTQVAGGFILHFPRRGEPTVIQPPVELDRLFAAFREYNEWLHVLGIGDVGSLNDAVIAGRLREVILVSEALHEKSIAAMAGHVVERRSQLVVIAGPSSSGKTTFSKRLQIQLLANGRRPFPLAMDNYFLERDKTARNERGERDYESLAGLDLDLQEVSESVYRRMEAERKRVANELRSTGGAEAEKIRADADRQREVIVAEAYRDAQRIKGAGDAKAAGIYGQAFNENPEFYAFWRSMEAYRQSFRNKSDVMEIDSGSDFMRYFRNPNQGKPAK